MSEFIGLSNNSDPSIPTSSGQHVLMKDQTKIKKAVRQTTIVVNSRDRNYLSYPNSNHFRYTLRRPLTNIISVELVNAMIPSVLFTIYSTWGSFTFLEGTTKYNVTLRDGYYTDSTILAELQTQLNAIVGIVNTYSVTQNPRDLSTIVEATNITPTNFSFLFYSGDFKDEIFAKVIDAAIDEWSDEENFMDALDETGDKTIIYVAPQQKTADNKLLSLFGTGLVPGKKSINEKGELVATDANQENPSKWKGLNRWGIALQAARARSRDDASGGGEHLPEDLSKVEVARAAKTQEQQEAARKGAIIAARRVGAY